jgi:hypothetical protein
MKENQLLKKACTGVAVIEEEEKVGGEKVSLPEMSYADFQETYLECTHLSIEASKNSTIVVNCKNQMKLIEVLCEWKLPKLKTITIYDVPAKDAKMATFLRNN